MTIPKEKGDGSSNSMPKTERDSKDETILAQEQVKQAQLKMQLHSTKKGDHETIESYVKKLKSTADSLAAINSPISDQDLVLQLLAGLPSQYLLLKNTISSQFPLPNFSKSCSMQYEYEKSLPGQSSTRPPLSSDQSENNNSNSSKSALETLHDIANAVTTMVSIGSKFCNAFGWSQTSTTNGGRGRGRGRGPDGGRGRGGGRGNCNKRGGGPSNNNNNSRNSGRR
ncbi:uncharacterized protein LOC132040552 [Lycium ferocissimum]|uniref:uncharacterized protein LOC132040552 n=1 Tax=Lycium ferocissimum TaxID=112874 RepID=UPI002814FCA2|nr:uncharacterized protein LOC132040552 [Lycium ferocissimum]